MRVNIKYPIKKCPICGEEFERKHNRQIYCSKECSAEAKRRQDTKHKLRYFYKNKDRIYATQIGTRSIGRHPNPDTEREHQIIKNEKERLGLKLF